MNRFNCALAAAVLGFSALVPKADAQVSVGVGVEPACPYGYYDYYPYACAPYGYYAPEWFAGGIFIGAGPWFHGPVHFQGHVDARFDVRHGYRGPLPNRGDHRMAWKPVDHIDQFRGNEMHDGRDRGGFSRG